MRGIKLLVDTNAVIKHLEGEKQLETILNSALIFLSAVSFAELLAGSLTSAEKAILDEYLCDVHIIHTNNFICETAAELRKAFRIKRPDALIAATGMFLDVPLLTFDHDLERINDLKIIKLTV